MASCQPGALAQPEVLRVHKPDPNPLPDHYERQRVVKHQQGLQESWEWVAEKPSREAKTNRIT